MGKKVIITGSTGMIGKGVLLECLNHTHIDEVLVINRSTLAMDHSKLTEILLPNFLDVHLIHEQLQGYDACFYCMGVSAVGMSEKKYHKITYTTTEAFANVLHMNNPEMTFIYVSGTGTDSSEQGRTMWARVKGKTENMLFRKGFEKVYAFRPGLIVPEKGIKSRTKLYRTIYTITRPLFPLFKRSNKITTTTKLGRAMIHTLFYPVEKDILHNPDINDVAKL